ncbi:Pheromone-binding protein-related protein 1 [Lucilia cuprina]|uniref:Pheromone-binding protein-related protein 1 n=1 Tax=Lucilia cuprina TaxID=7375 RepID=A0A0L0BWM6_LUCCU|nr:Pheromone-binding protein-related protein 1 [Lucilia cuprina]
MKFWIIFTIITVIATLVITNNALEIPEHLKKHARKLHKRCQNQTETPDDIIRSSLKGELPKNKNFECYVHCIFDIIGIMDENNIIRIELLTQVLPEELHPTLTMLSDNCGTKEGSDKCNIAYNTLQCYIDNNPLMIKQDLEFLFD